MPEPRHWYLITYDVSEPRALRKVHKTLSAWGKPIQLSVFRTRCTDRELEQLRFELTKLIADADRLMIIRLCEGCASRVTVQGDLQVDFDPEPPPFQLL